MTRSDVVPSCRKPVMRYLIRWLNQDTRTSATNTVTIILVYPLPDFKKSCLKKIKPLQKPKAIKSEQHLILIISQKEVVKCITRYESMPS